MSIGSALLMLEEGFVHGIANGRKATVRIVSTKNFELIFSDQLKVIFLDDLFSL